MFTSKMLLLAPLAILPGVFANILPRQQNATLDSCPGYKASDVKTSGSGLTASLTLAGTACNVYGTDLEELSLIVEYQSDQRLHVKIQDPANEVYQVPESVFERPSGEGSSSSNASELQFKYKENPFSFSVVRRSSGEVLFDTSAAPIVFEDQYLRLRTSLPDSPSLYGLGEHSDPFMLNTTNYTRTIWNRDSYRIPTGSNLYGAHPVYYDHRGDNGTHAVFLLNSNGMDIKIDDSNGQFLEYNTIGGIIDLYFLAGPTPVEAARQYSEVVGKAVMMPYWGFGFHQCRYGMRDVYEVAEVVANYSQAGIPLETMWTDIDYMYQRWVFTLDPERFPLKLVRDLVDTLHGNDQHYIVMVDPAVAYAPDSDYEAFDKGTDIFMKFDNGSLYRGVVWPGQTVYPSWFNSRTQDYWNEEFLTFFDADTGVDIDALWIDMNEASNFCAWPCLDPPAEAASQGLPPKPPAIRLGSPRPIPGFSDSFQPQCKAVVTFNVDATTFQGENILILGSSITLGNDNVVNAAPLSANTYPIWSAAIDMPANATFTYQYVRSQPDGTFIYENGNRTVTTGGCDSTGSTQDTIRTSSPPQNKFKRQIKPARPSAPLQKRQAGGNGVGLPGRDLLNPAYAIQNDAGTGVISDRTIRTDLIHEGGYAEYDTHNLYGAMMSEASRVAMLARRPSLRPLIITRSTFAGSGRQVGHWLGDNGADWSFYLISIAQLLDFSALFGFSFVGSDVCGFSGETNENNCARWASLGAFSSFYRNHREVNFTPHEFYRSPLVAESARNAIEVRYKLLDYIYTAMHEQTQSGTPLIQPMFFAYPSDPNTNSLQYQYFYGPGLLVAPVTEENSTSASFYLPDDIFYDYYTHETVRGQGEIITVTDVPYTSIPLYYKGGSIIALRANSANTTTLLRKENFQIIIAPGLDGKASGSLYLDDGVSLDQEATSNIEFSYDYESSEFKMGGTFGYDAGVIIESITVLGRSGGPATLVPITADLTGPATLEV